MIINACAQNRLAHPVSPSLPCPVLQYVDDMLIIIKADPQAVANLKKILDDFSLATSLSINFQKTMIVPMNVDPQLAADMEATLGATTAAFPQKYLGLPLSPHKLPRLALQPLIDRCDTYLAGWRWSPCPYVGRSR